MIDEDIQHTFCLLPLHGGANHWHHSTNTKDFGALVSNPGQLIADMISAIHILPCRSPPSGILPLNNGGGQTSRRGPSGIDKGTIVRAEAGAYRL